MFLSVDNHEQVLSYSCRFKKKLNMEWNQLRCVTFALPGSCLYIVGHAYRVLTPLPLLYA